MKKTAAVLLAALLILAGLTYSVGYGHSRLGRSGNSLFRKRQAQLIWMFSGPDFKNRQAQLIEAYLKMRAEPDGTALTAAWTEAGEQRLNNLQTEITLLWTRILERVNDLCG